uniref:Macaca fascicularis brain cDNA clone: QflA-18284, similar to human ADP-ribosylation factor-like 6 interacting protein(ARL6IP), mRNA, RefSeq: NM_015161.1 n=1 Tax=Macaca fascicularis TaxID=9541 RepID=I7GC46_MACFA|nr:unnamed protein product [Macaca fascicularis]
MLYLVVYLSLLNKCFFLFNIAVNSGAHCSICFFLIFHKKTTLILPYFHCK